MGTQILWSDINDQNNPPLIVHLEARVEEGGHGFEMDNSDVRL